MSVFRITRMLLTISRATFKPKLCLSKLKPLRLASITSKFRYYSSVTNKSNEEEILQGNPYYKKYEDKIKKLQEENRDGFLSRIQELAAKNTKKKACESAQPKESKNGKLNSKDHKNCHQPSYTQKKKLDDILKLEKITSLKANEIEVVWRSYHDKKDSLCAAIPVDAYETMHNRSLECPNFIYALAKKGGYEFILGQFSGNTCYFTPLISYQTYKEEAPVCLTLNHFTEMASEKGIILMSGEFDNNIITAIEAQFLANQVQLFYVTNNLKRKLLLWTFNKEPQNFKHTDIIHELESSISV